MGRPMGPGMSSTGRPWMVWPMAYTRYMLSRPGTNTGRLVGYSTTDPCSGLSRSHAHAARWSGAWVSAVAGGEVVSGTAVRVSAPVTRSAPVMME